RPGLDIGNHAAPNGAWRAHGGGRYYNMALLAELAPAPLCAGLLNRLLLVQRFEDVTLVVLYLELLEKLEIFLPERFALMVLFLIPNVFNDAFQLRVAIRKCAETLLPTKPARHPPVLVD